MFGKPEWFRTKNQGRGLAPITFKGWVYTTAWWGVIGMPFLALVTRGLAWESLIWLAASMVAFSWDVRQIRREKESFVADQDILVIDDHGVAHQMLDTERFRFWRG